MPKSIRSPRHQRLIDALIEARREAELTQAALAERLGRPQSFIAKVENGERRLDVIEFIDLVEAAEAQPQNILAEVMSVRTAKSKR